MTAVLVCPTRSTYPFPVPDWVAGIVEESCLGIGRARNTGAEKALLKYNLTDDDWLLFVDDDTELPKNTPPPPEGFGLAVPIYKPAWPGFEKDYSTGTHVGIINTTNILGLGPVTVGSCIAVRVGVWNLLGRFPESDDLWEDTMFGATARARGVRWVLWKAYVQVHRTYSNEWAVF